ncbi:hypothetical protein ZIOFF_032151 [Zingiber officinale]|uniref:Uncharacterized protein n=1 Tax=Zingiber officinale TaxID=94328 RepID=A0A8J5GIM0_ZINOF|nr:hypothetical protein ZIOFF_032151 [Zingiber officinale]
MAKSRNVARRLTLFLHSAIDCSSFLKNPKENMRLTVAIAIIFGIVLGFFGGISFPSSNVAKLRLNSSITPYMEDRKSGLETQALLSHTSASAHSHNRNDSLPPYDDSQKDLQIQQKFLVTFTVGYDQKKNIDAAIKKNTMIMFDIRGIPGTKRKEFSLGYSDELLLVIILRWFAKRFLHPDIVAPYDYIFIWDEDLGVEHFNAEEYIKLVKKHGLEISQPGLEANEHLTWKMTQRRRNKEVHKESEEKSGWCPDPHLPPCAAFIEIMAPVFSREAWRCAWHMIQNDLVHGWGLDFALRRCVEFAHERIGIVDAQWIVHQGVPTLGNQVEDRCREEWRMFQDRMASAEKAYFETHAKP